MRAVDRILAVLAEEILRFYIKNPVVAVRFQSFVKRGERGVRLPASPTPPFLHVRPVDIKNAFNQHDGSLRMRATQGLNQYRHTFRHLLRRKVRQRIEHVHGGIELRQQSRHLGFGLTVARKSQVDDGQAQPPAENRRISHARPRRDAALRD